MGFKKNSNRSTDNFLGTRLELHYSSTMKSPTLQLDDQTQPPGMDCDISSISSCGSFTTFQESVDRDADEEVDHNANGKVSRRRSSGKRKHRVYGSLRQACTPLQSSLVGNLRRRLEKQMVDKSCLGSADNSKISPGLALLQSEPGLCVKKKHLCVNLLIKCKLKL